MRERLSNYYGAHDELERIDRLARVHIAQLAATQAQVDRFVAPGSRVLDCCCGKGTHCLALAKQGYSVYAGDLLEEHVSHVRAADAEGLLEGCAVVDARDLSAFSPDSFDAVLCLGALYHLPDSADRERVVREVHRVLRPGGHGFLGYINRAAALLKRLKDRPDDFEDAAAEYESRCVKGVFYHSDPQEAELLARRTGFHIAAHVGSSGMTPLVRESLDRMSEDQFGRFLELHLRTCSDPTTLGMSLHGLVVAEKRVL